jgi:hypothetical protein
MFVKFRLTNCVVRHDLKQDSESAYKIKPLELTEQVMADGIQYRQINMTLYTVHDDGAPGRGV